MSKIEDSLEAKIYNELESLHGQPIADERGGQVAVNQARMLLDILDIQYNSIRGWREHEFIDGRKQECVDLSDVLEECEEFDI